MKIYFLNIILPADDLIVEVVVINNALYTLLLLLLIACNYEDSTNVNCQNNSILEFGKSNFWK